MLSLCLPGIVLTLLQQVVPHTYPLMGQDLIVCLYQSMILQISENRALLILIPAEVLPPLPPILSPCLFNPKMIYLNLLSTNYGTNFKMTKKKKKTSSKERQVYTICTFLLLTLLSSFQCFYDKIMGVVASHFRIWSLGKLLLQLLLILICLSLPHIPDAPLLLFFFHS